MKKLFCLLLAAALLLGQLPPALAEEITLAEPGEDPILLVDPSAEPAASGACGPGLTWRLEGAELTISGSGPMSSWSDRAFAPWYEQRAEIESVIVQGGVTSIGDYAFYDCNSLSSVSLPDSVTAFGYQSFRDCTALRSIALPGGLSDLGMFSFYGCGLESVTVPGGVEGIFGSFAYCPALETVTLGEGVLRMDDWAFRGCSALREITLPSTLNGIGVAAFRDCASLTALELPAGLTEIGAWAFCGSGLESLAIPEGLSLVDERAFENCASLADLELPSTLTEIAYMGFAGCTALPEVTLPAALQSIGDKAFAGCETLSSVTFTGSAPEMKSQSFSAVRAEVFYPADDDSWIEGLRQDYGGTLRWTAYSPLQPPALTVTGQSTAGIALAWTDPAPGAEQFELQRSFGGAWETLALLNGESYTDGGLRMGQSCSYRLRARCGGVWSDFCSPVSLSFQPFADVSGKKTLEYVAWAYNNGIVTGVSPTSFKPDSSCTRVQFVMMLWKMHGSRTVSGTNPFADVSGAKTTKAVLWALDAGVINTARNFYPDDSISRVQIVMILWKLAGSPGVEGDCPFRDVSGKKTVNAVLWAYQNGITKGVSESSFAPDRACTRVQLVIFLYKYNELRHVL